MLRRVRIVNTDEIVKMLEEIRAAEVKARDFYAENSSKFKDGLITKTLNYLKDEEERHIKTTLDMIEAMKKYKPEDSLVKESMSGFTDTSAFILSLETANYQKTNAEVLKYLINERGMSCVYLALNKPCSSILQILKNSGVDTTKVSFIDVSAAAIEHDHPVVSPENLTELSLMLSEQLEKIKGPKFLHVDAVSTYYIFHKSDLVETFVHSLIRKMKDKKVGLILLAINEEIDKRSLARLTTFVDKVIER